MRTEHFIVCDICGERREVKHYDLNHNGYPKKLPRGWQAILVSQRSHCCKKQDCRDEVEKLREEAAAEIGGAP